MLAVACFKDPRGEYCMHETFNPSEDIFDSDYVVSRIWYFMYLAQFHVHFVLDVSHQ